MRFGGPTGGIEAWGFGPTPNVAFTHRFYEVAIPRSELGNSARLGVNIDYSSPSFRLLRFVNQLNSLNGRVVDAQTSQPIAGAIAAVAGVTRVTALDGAFAFTNVSLGASDNLQVTKTNYATARVSIPAAAQGNET